MRNVMVRNFLKTMINVYINIYKSHKYYLCDL